MAERMCGQCINWRNGWCRMRKQERHPDRWDEFAGDTEGYRPCYDWQAWPGLWNGDRSAWATDTDQTCEECDGTCSCGDCVAYTGKPCRFRNIDLTTDPLDIHSAWDAEQQRIETKIRVSVHDEETAERLRAAHELADDGLPPLAEGSRWDGTGVVDSTSTRTLVWIAEAHDQSGVWFTTEIESREHGAWLANVRNVIARHDRANGYYWADEIRKLAASARVLSSGKLEELLARLHEKGVC